MADYWIKVYHEILDDPKMATMPDRLWRRVIEIFLIAGKLSKDKSGILPETNQLAWLLRMNTDDLALDLKQLETSGIIKRIENGWSVVNFEKRQSAVSGTERVQQFRKRQQNEQYYDNVTDLKRNVTESTEYIIQNTESETEIENRERVLSDFDETLDYLKVLTGYPASGKASVDAINDIIKMKATVCDVRNGFEWLANQGKTVRYYSSLVGPTQTAMSKRIQQENLKPKKYEPILRKMVHPDGTVEEVLA